MNLSKSNNARLRTIKSDGKVRKRKSRGYQSRAADLPNRRPSRGQVYMDFGRQAIQDLNYLRRFINTEVHYSDVAVAAAGTSTTPTFNLLNGSQTGDGASNRSGISIKLNRCDLRYILTNNATAVTTFTRIMVIRDNQPNAAIFAIGDLLNATTMVSPYTVSNQMRFVVMYDEVIALSTAGPANSAQVSSPIGCNFHVEYNTGNAGTIADINTNSLYLVYFSNQATDTPTFQAYVRTWFVDN